MITKEQVPQLIGRPMFDSSHHKVGDVGQVYLDTASGEPEWMSIRTGLLGTKETFVPLRSAELQGDEVYVPFGADKIKHAPRVGTREGSYPRPRRPDCTTTTGCTSARTSRASRRRSPRRRRSPPRVLT